MPPIYLDIKVSVRKQGTLTFEIEGWHDAFPDYEWLIEIGKNKVSGYQYSSPAPGPGIGSDTLGVGGNLVFKTGLSILNLVTTTKECPCE